MGSGGECVCGKWGRVCGGGVGWLYVGDVGGKVWDGCVGVGICEEGLLGCVGRVWGCGGGWGRVWEVGEVLLGGCGREGVCGKSGGRVCGGRVCGDRCVYV